VGDAGAQRDGASHPRWSGAGNTGGHGEERFQVTRGEKVIYTRVGIGPQKESGYTGSALLMA